MTAQGKLYNSAAELLDAIPAGGRHYRSKEKLYTKTHTMLFAKECSRAAAERVRLAIYAMLKEEESTVAQVMDLVDKMNVEDYLK